MKLLVLFATVLLSCAALHAAMPANSPVVVELFTSEGCSSCPPADALLIELGQNASGKTPDVIVLGEHVDYWNHDGWTDRFSSASFSKRQEDYVRRFQLASAYTPQMVIDGRTQLVGNDRSGVYRAIAAAAATARSVNVTLTWKGANRLHIVAQLPGSEKALVQLAVTEDGLSSAVAHGENGGRTIHHAGVVRQLQTIGKVKNGRFDGEIEVPRKSDWNAKALKAVVFVQEGDDSPILGAASLPFTP